MPTKIPASDLNSVRNSTYSVLGTTSTGYGVGLTSADVSVGQIITTSSFHTIVEDIRRCWIHQTGRLDGFPRLEYFPKRGDLIFSRLVNALPYLVSMITLDAYTTPPASQLAQTSLATSTSTVFVNTRITHRIDYTFTDNADANYFFNLGGNFAVGVSHARATSPGWSAFVDWANSKVSAFSYGRNQWVAPVAINTSYTSGTNYAVDLSISAQDNHTIRTTLTLTNLVSTVSIPTTATTYVTYSIPGSVVQEQQTYYGIQSPVPQARIVSRFGTSQTPVTVPIKKLSVDALSPFTLPYDSSSNSQSVIIRNIGNTATTINSIIFDSIYVPNYFRVDLSSISFPRLIDPGSNFTFNLTYFLANNGFGYNLNSPYDINFSIYSDTNDSPNVVTTQLTVVPPVFDFYLTPNPWNYTYNYRDGRIVTQPVIVGGKGSFTTITYGTDGNFSSRGFSIGDSTTVVGFNISFNPAGLTNGTTYTTTVNIGINGVTHAFTATIILDVLPNITSHLGSWVSAYQRDNGVIGASYDIINGTKCITLGFGTGGDGSSNVSHIPYGEFVGLENLGIGANADADYTVGPVLYPSGSNVGYSNFLKPYDASTNLDGHGVWVNDTGWYPVGKFVARTFTFTAPVTGFYTYRFAADNQAWFSISGELVGELRSSNQNFSPVQESFRLENGVKTLVVYFYNDPGFSDRIRNPGSVALVITGPDGNTVWDTNWAVRRSYNAYQYWNEVYRIPLHDSTATDAIFYSKNYIIKNLSPLNGYSYGSYFGYTGSIQEGSMFTVIQDPYNNVTISLNPKSDRDVIDKTTNYAFPYLMYYYSGVLGSDRLTQLESDRGDGQTLYFTGFNKNGAVTTLLLPQPPAPYIPPAGGGGDGGGGGSVSVNVYMPYNKLAGAMAVGDPLLLLSPDGNGTVDGTIISTRISQQKLLTLVSISGIRLTCSNNTPLTLRDGSCINSTEAVGNLLPVQDSNGFRWEEIVEVIDAGTGQVTTIFCNNQCYAAGDEPERWIWTHNAAMSKI